MKKGYQGFTLVELIIVITILAILSVSAFLVVSQWIGKSRDSRRLSDLGTIQRALEVSLTENAKYPIPDSAVNITAGSIIIGQQGKFGDSARSATDIKTTPMDPLDNVAYTYYVATGGKNYQVMGFLENSSILTFRGIEAQGPRSTVNYQEDLQFSNSACPCNGNGTNSICSVAFFASLAFCLNYAHASEVSAADYSTRVPTVKGNQLGILITSGTNQPVEDLGAAIDIAATNTIYQAVLADNNKLIGTGLTLVSLKSISQNGYNQSLVGYWDMETTIGPGLLADLSSNGNVGSGVSGIPIGTVAGKVGMATNFTSACPHIAVNDSNSLKNFPNGISISLWAKTNSPDGGHHWLISKGNYNGAWNPYAYGMVINNANGADDLTSLIPLTQTGGISHIAQDYISFNQWQFFTITYDKKILRTYKNGQAFSTHNYASEIFSNNEKLRIGALSNGTSGFMECFNGVLDEIRIYNKVLSDSEIQSLYNSTK